MQRRIDDGEDFLDAVLNVDRHLEESRIVLQTATFCKTAGSFPLLRLVADGQLQLLDISIEREPHGMSTCKERARTIKV